MNSASLLRIACKIFTLSAKQLITMFEALQCSRLQYPSSDCTKKPYYQSRGLIFLDFEKVNRYVSITFPYTFFFCHSNRADRQKSTCITKTEILNLRHLDENRFEFETNTTIPFESRSASLVAKYPSTDPQKEYQHGSRMSLKACTRQANA